MKTITKNEMNVLLILFKHIDIDYNANNLSKKIGLTSMGTLKILKNLKKEKFLRSKKLGKAVFYKPDLNDYTRTYVKFLLQKEAEQSIPRIKRWIRELRKFQNSAEIGILFGSILKKERFNDVDLLLVLKKSQNSRINQLVNEINKLNIKKIHLVKQTKKDIESNLKKKNKVIFSIIRKGIVLFGYNKLIRIIENVTR